MFEKFCRIVFAVVLYCKTKFSFNNSTKTVRIIMDETQIENAEMRKIRKMLEAEAGHPIHTLKFPENTLWVDDENDKSIEGNQTLWSEIEERKMLKNKNKTPKKAPVLLPKPKKVPSRVQKALLDIRNKISPNRKKYRLD